MDHSTLEEPVVNGVTSLNGPSFRLIERKPPRPEAILLAILVAVGVLYALTLVRMRKGATGLNSDQSGAARSTSTPSEKRPSDDDNDDPSQIDTIILGDPADAPVPGRRGDHVSPVHPTILVRLPRYGDQVGLIPDTPAGRLLHGWLAAFNQSSLPMLESSLPTNATGSTAAAQLELRRQTGGFSLLSAKEVAPGVLVFRLREQKPPQLEALGTLQLRSTFSPAAIASFSLRSVESGTRTP